ncbi:MAG: phosphocarrier protein HPr [Moorella sp. (in: firmicutes)]|nr:phosphocarrier protein HPr [Moorella sp. (in: firmicutes)]
MPEARVILKNPSGLHARPAAAFVQAANGFIADISVQRDGKEANGKSILAVMGLGAKCGNELVIRAAGADADQALATLVELVQAGLGEDELAG